MTGAGVGYGSQLLRPVVWLHPRRWLTAAGVEPQGCSPPHGRCRAGLGTATLARDAARASRAGKVGRDARARLRRVGAVPAAGHAAVRGHHLRESGLCVCSMLRASARACRRACAFLAC
eukprot:2194564-Rhodomonas_salina.1